MSDSAAGPHPRRLTPAAGSLPIRTRLALTYTGLLIAALVLFGAGVFVALSTELERSFDAALIANAEHAAGAFTQDVGPDGRIVPKVRLLHQFASTGGRVEILDGSGRPIADSGASGAPAPASAASPSASPAALSAAPPLPITAADLEAARAGTHAVRELTLGGDRTRLVVDAILGPSRAIAGFVVWADSTRDLDSLLRSVALALVVGGLLVTALAFAGGWALSRRALAPVTDVTETARAISLSGDFGARVEVSQTGDEVAELAVAFNEMLSALEANHQALQRFLGDASHELRTPLTTIRGSLDLLARPDLDPEERSALVDDARSETARMARLVGDLLSLARAETGARMEFSHVEVDAILLESVRQAGGASPGVRMEVGTIEPASAEGDRDRLKELFLIVLDNAARYTPAGGHVRADLRVAGQEVQITFTDTGIGIPESERERVFDRLYRGAGARSLRPSGTGLGLAIARWIAEAHGGTIRLGGAEGGGTRVSIILPSTAA